MINVRGYKTEIKYSAVGPYLKKSNEKYDFLFDFFHPQSATKFLLLGKGKYDRRGQLPFRANPGPNAVTFTTAFSSPPKLLVLAVGKGEYLLHPQPIAYGVGTTGYALHLPEYNKAETVRLITYIFEAREVDIWRERLFACVEECARESSKLAFVDADIAFEMFIGTYLTARLAKIGIPNLDKALRRYGKEWLKFVIASPKISKFNYRTTHKPLYDQWLKNRKIRDDIVHRGMDVSQEVTRDSIVNILRFMAVIDAKAFPRRLLRLI